MKKIFSTAILACAIGLNALALSGCLQAARAPLQSAELDELAKQFQPDPDYATVYLYRNKQTLASVHHVPVNMNDETVGQLTNESYLMLRVSPGDYLITAVKTPFVVAENIYPIRIEIDRNKIAYIQLFLDNPFRFELIDADQAQKDIKKRKLSRAYPSGVVIETPIKVQ